MYQFSKAAYAEWGEIDMALRRFSLKRFGDGVKCEGEREDTSWNVRFSAMPPSARESYLTLAKRYDPDGDLDAEEEWDDNRTASGYYNPELSEGASNRLIADLFKLKFKPTACCATYNGVYFFAGRVEIKNEDAF